MSLWIPLLLYSLLGPQPAPPRVLFIGNSLTRANDLPQMVEALAAAAGRPVEVHARLGDGLSLDDHWQRGARAAVAQGGWTWLVLQQGPSALPESRVDLRASVARYAALAKETGARVGVYMVWPSKVRTRDFDRVVESYRLAAADVGARVLPAGDAWRTAWRRDARLPLYGRDDFHPSETGTFLAALVITAGLLNLDPATLPCDAVLRGGRRVTIPEASCGMIRAAAAAAVTPGGGP